MENVEVFNRPIGNYKTIHLLCKFNRDDYLEVTKYPDGNILLNMNTTIPEDTIVLTSEQLEKLLEELK